MKSGKSTIAAPRPAGSPKAAHAEREIHRLRDLTADQWKSGIAAWLGWLFDGLDMHLYTLVAIPFVAELLAVDARRPVGGHVQLRDSGRVPGRLGAGGWLLRSHRRPHGPQPRADADDSHLCRVHRPVVLRPDLVAVADLPISWPRWASAASGPSAPRCCRRPGPPLAPVAGGRAANGGQLRRHAGLAGHLPDGRAELPNRAVFLVGILPALGHVVDSPRRARDRAMARGQARSTRTTSPACGTCFAATCGARPC